MALPEVAVAGQAPSPFLPNPAQETPRLNVPIRDTPQSISVVPRQLIDERAANTVREALRNVTGISLAAGEGGASGDNLTLRGFTASNDFYLDGLRDIGQYTRDPFFLDSVEVLKGPASTLFGRGSTGGVINQTSRLPQARTFGSAEISGYAPGGIRSTADVNVYAGDVGMRLDLMSQKIDDSGRSHITNERWGVAPSITFGLGTNTQLTFHYLHQEENNTPYFGVPYVNGRPAPVSRESVYGVRGIDNEHTLTDVFTARLQHRFSDEVTLRNTFRYGTYMRDIRSTSPRIIGSLQGNLLTGSILPMTGSTNLSTVLVNREPQWRRGRDSIADNLTELLLNFRTGPVRNTATVGLELSDENSDLRRYNVTDSNTAGTILSRFVNPASLLNPDFDQVGAYNRSIRTNTHVNAFTAAAYAVDQVSITEKVDLLAGLRYDHFGADYLERVANQRLSRDDNMPSYRAGIVYKPTDAARVYFVYGTSFNPSAQNLTLAANTANLAPEKNRTFEIGGNWTVLDGLEVRGALFRIEKTNARTTDPASGLITLAGNQKVDGFEISTTGRVLPGWNIIAGYTYLDANIVSSTNPAEVGHPPLNVPRNTATVWSTYDLPSDIQIGGGISYVGSRPASNTGVGRVPSYARYDLALSWQPSEGPMRGVRFQLNALNLSDKRYYETVHPGNVTIGAGRTFVASVGYRF